MKCPKCGKDRNKTVHKLDILEESYEKENRNSLMAEENGRT